jgi:hypothetical protein
MSREGVLLGLFDPIKELFSKLLEEFLLSPEE